MATYNGERYIKEQIDSLFSQTISNWTLYIHDDGSSDNTVGIIKEYMLFHDNIVLLDYASQHGAKENFFSLVKAVDADYYMFSDQDDKWCPYKIEKEIERMAQLEKEYNNRPLLVFSDLYVVDKNLNLISPSLWQMSGARPEFLTTFNECAATPFVTGCTMLFNRDAKNAIIWPVGKATMHDAWITLCILKRGGIISAIYEPLMYYRQHDGNALGASNKSNNSLFHKICNIRKIIKRDVAILKMLDALGYGGFFKFLKYKYIYKFRCRYNKNRYQCQQQPS